MTSTKSPLIWVVHITTALLVLLWLFPTVGLFVSSFRTTDQISSSGWWNAMSPSTKSEMIRTADPDDFAKQIDGEWVVAGNLFKDKNNTASNKAEIVSWGTSSKAINAYQPGAEAKLKKNRILVVKANGDYRLSSPDPITGRSQRVFLAALSDPEYTTSNYGTVLSGGSGGDSMVKAFFNTLTVTIPATIIPILIAAFAAYALAWMNFPGRALLIAFIVGLLVVPLQLALIPLLRLHLDIGIGKGYLGVWLAHTGFGMPLAIYLLRNYMVGLPKDIIENAKVDGATDFQIFTRIILPLSFPALASFAIFQFLWTWNDLLVAKVFLIDATGNTTVMTNQIVELLGTRGGNWEILATAAFISIAVPLLVFFSMQRYLVRGLLAGSVK